MICLEENEIEFFTNGRMGFEENALRIHELKVGLSRWVCMNCGEELFDLKAMKEIRAQRERNSVNA